MPEPITFLLTDIEGSTRLWERDPDEMRRALARHDELAAQAIAAHGGSVVKPRGEGDSIFSVFANAADATHGAVAFQRALHEEVWPEGFTLRARMALHTGPAERREDDYYGPVVNRAARLRAIGHGQQTLLSGAAWEAAEGRVPPGCDVLDLGLHRLKDLSVPEHVHQLSVPGLPEEFPPLASLHPHLTNLPSHLGTLIDREEEVAELEDLLMAARLVTLIGPTGIGKTRLALHVGAELTDQFAEGVWLVDIAPLADEDAIAAMAATVLGVDGQPGRSPLETLVAGLAGKHVLLVLDNCEHLLDACADLARTLIAACPRLSILATSHEPLGISGEVTWATPALAEPAAGLLFTARAAQAGAPPAGLAPETAQAIGRRLRGVPLAIELAAARIASSSPEEILADLDAGPAIDTLLHDTHEELDDNEQAALRRLSVFSGPFEADAARHVLEDLGDPLATLDSLVRRSLVSYDPAAGEAPYRVGPPVRHYAGRRLEESGEAHATAAAHATWHLEAAQRGSLTGGALHHDVRRAMAWTMRERPDDALRLCVALHPHWAESGHHEHGLETIESVLRSAPDDARSREQALAAAADLRAELERG